MLGGRESYGAGGYLDTPLEEALPVYMTVRDRERSPDVAMVAVVDKSGSMADCHCTGDNRDSANPSGQRGFEKVDIAKEAILRAAEALAPTDQLSKYVPEFKGQWVIVEQDQDGPSGPRRSTSARSATGSASVRMAPRTSTPA